MGIAVDKIKGSVDASVIRIDLNDMGDYTVISADDDALFGRFVEEHENISKKADQFSIETSELMEKKEGDDSAELSAEMIRRKRAFSEEVAKATDHIFGEGTIRKVFRGIYEEIPDFVPSAESIVTFLDDVTPQIEQLFRKKIDDRNKASKARMAKYQVQDYKRPQKKGASK